MLATLHTCAQKITWLLILFCIKVLQTLTFYVHAHYTTDIKPVTHKTQHDTHLIQTDEPGMGLGLVRGQQDAVPWRPVAVFVPAHQHQIVQILPGAQHALATPDVLHQVAQIALLQ